MIFQKKSAFTVSYPVSLEEVKIHFLGCFDDSNFDLNFKNSNDSEIISIKSQVIGTEDIPIVPASIKLDLYHDFSTNLKNTKFNGTLTINYLDIIGTLLIAATLIIVSFLNQELTVSNIITLTLFSAVLIIYPIYRMNQIKLDKTRLFELLDDVTEACQIGD